MEEQGEVVGVGDGGSAAAEGEASEDVEGTGAVPAASAARSLLAQMDSAAEAERSSRRRGDRAEQGRWRRRQEKRSSHYRVLQGYKKQRQLKTDAADRDNG